MIASFTPSTPRDKFFYPQSLLQEANDNNGIYMSVPRKHLLRGLPSGTPIYVGSINSASDAQVRIIYQFPHLHFHLCGHALSIKHPKLRAYLQYHYPEHFI